MTWKHGKHRTGRTIRSSFPRRSEGILLRKKKLANLTFGSDEESENVIYSLGKQNRWMMPEMVKEPSGFEAYFGDEDFVLVDRRSKTKNDLSIYDSDSGSIFGSSCKVSTIDTKATKADVVFEVSSPDFKGVWPFEREEKSPQSSRKNKKHHKTRNGGVHVEEEWYPFDDDHLHTDDNDDDDDDDDNRLMDHSVSLCDYIPEFLVNDRKTSSSTKKARKNISNDKNEHVIPENKLIIVEDEELAKKHKRMHEFTTKRDNLLRTILYDVHDCLWCWDGHCYDNKKKRQKRQRRTRKELSSMMEKVENNSNSQGQQEIQGHQSVEMSYAPEFCETILIENDIKASDLQHAWGELYNEGGSFPRKFAINVTSSDGLHYKTSLESSHVLFKLKDGGNKTDNKIPASIMLLIESQLIPIETQRLISKDFCDIVGARADSDAVSVEDVIDKAKRCIEKHLSSTSDSGYGCEHVQSAPCDLRAFEGLTGWKGQVYPEREAMAEIKKDLNTKLNNCRDSLCTLKHDDACGICFNTITDTQDFTKLALCNHSFCNDCWKAYIDTKFKSGQVDMLCPEHGCKIVIDPVTIMALAPSWYGKYFSWKVKRTMAASKSWRNCSSENCCSVVKLLPCENISTKPIPANLPVSCGCKRIWCYSCKEQAHWPSTCENARKFRAANTGYSQPTVSEITTVEVKKCPQCSYPIEKYYGCDHMYCIMCNSLFCWYCLKTLNVEEDEYYNHNCYDDKKETRTTAVELPLLISDAQRVANVAVRSSFIVKAGMSVKKEKRIKSLKQGMESYSSLTRISKKYQDSRIGITFERITKLHLSLTDIVRTAHAFELQAHIALEGIGICIICNDMALFEQFSILAYIIEKLSDILDNPSSWKKTKNIERLTKLTEMGMQCLHRIQMKKLKN